jgi:hypothetical protein
MSMGYLRVGVRSPGGSHRGKVVMGWSLMDISGPDYFSGSDRGPIAIFYSQNILLYFGSNQN